MRWYGFEERDAAVTFSGMARRVWNLRSRSAKTLFRRAATLGDVARAIVPSNCDGALVTTSSGLVSYVFSDTYFFVTPFPRFLLSVFYDPDSRVFEARSPARSPFCGLFRIFAQRAFSGLFGVVCRKMRFRGKGYYVYKNRRFTIAPQFGYSHAVRLYNSAFGIKTLSKTAILLFGLDVSVLVDGGRVFRSLRPINIFTGKGARFASQIVYRKTGKVSSYR